MLLARGKLLLQRLEKPHITGRQQQSTATPCA